MRHLLPLLIVILLGGVAAGHAAKIDVASDPEADFASYRTYAWRVTEGQGDDFTGSQIRAAADPVLAGKGLQRVGADADPDLWIEYRVGSADGLRAGWIATIDWWAQPVFVPGARSSVEAGILLVISDAEEDKPVWGGTATQRGNNPDSLMVLSGRVDKITRKLLSNYPGARP